MGEPKRIVSSDPAALARLRNQLKAVEEGKLPRSDHALALDIDAIFQDGAIDKDEWNDAKKALQKFDRWLTQELRKIQSPEVAGSVVHMVSNIGPKGAMMTMREKVAEALTELKDLKKGRAP